MQTRSVTTLSAAALLLIFSAAPAYCANAQDNPSGLTQNDSIRVTRPPRTSGQSTPHHIVITALPRIHQNEIVRNKLGLIDYCVAHQFAKAESAEAAKGLLRKLLKTGEVAGSDAAEEKGRQGIVLEITSETTLADVAQRQGMDVAGYCEFISTTNL